VNDYEHKGVTQLFGVDARYDLTSKWMIGAQGSVLYAQSVNNWDYGFGLYTSYNVMINMLLTLGYNWEGYEDRDFSLQTYRIEGPYLQFRMKLDQENLKDVVRMMSW
jgi:opacity protein-like surface antigen